MRFHCLDTVTACLKHSQSLPLHGGDAGLPMSRVTRSLLAVVVTFVDNVPMSEQLLLWPEYLAATFISLQ